MAAIVNEQLCTACGICADQCPDQAITVNNIAHVDAEKCTECGVCVDECPNEAISLPGQEGSDDGATVPGQGEIGVE